MTELNNALNASTAVNAEMAVADLLIVLNASRAEAGRDPLKGWNASKDKLLRSIETSRENVKNLDPKIIGAEGDGGSKLTVKPDAKAEAGKKLAAHTDANKAKVTKPDAKKEAPVKEARFFPKGVFKSKAPVMKDERGKVWKKVDAKLSDGKTTEACFESTKGTYFYLFLKTGSEEVCYSGKIADFAKKGTNGDVKHFDLSSVG